MHIDHKSNPIEFASSCRGVYIMSKALWVAIKTLKKVEPAHMVELSDIADMEYILKGVFSDFFELHDAMDIGEDEDD